MAADTAAAGCYDVVVLGAGVIGSSAALAASRRGLRVAVVEKHELGHRHGSSHGCSRIIRRTYPDEHYTAMMTRAYSAWDQVTADAGLSEPLVQRKGGLDLMPSGSPLGQILVDAAVKEGLATEQLTHDCVLERFGIVVPGSYRCVYQADTGVLNADACCTAIREACRRRGVVFFASTEVTAVRALAAGAAGTAGVEVDLAGEADGTVSTGSLIVCPGAAAEPVLRSVFGLSRLPALTPVRVHVHYVALAGGSGPPPPVVIDYADWGPGKQHGGEASVPVYLMPANGHPGSYKVACHLGYPADGVVPPEREFADRLRPWLETRTPGLDASGGALASDSCWYTNTRDEDFVVDDITARVFPAAGAEAGRVILGAGFSGHGFKMAPVVGEMLTRLALGEPPAVGDEPLLDKFRFGRLLAGGEDS